MNFSYFLAKRITVFGHRTFSKMIIRVTIGALSLAILAIIMAVAILKGFKQEITDKQRGFFGDIMIVKNDVSTSYENAPIALSRAKLDSIRELPNVENIYPFATKAGIIHVNQEVEGVLIKGIDGSYRQDFLSRMLVEGDTINFAAENANNQILISQQTANRLHLKVGDSFIMYFVQHPVRKRKLEVKGIYTTHSEELDKMYIIGSLDLIRRINDMAPEDVGGYEVRIKDFTQLALTSSVVEDELPIHMATTNVVEQMPDVFNWLELLDMNDSVIFVLMVIVALINLISALLINILERSSMIGILKALGMRNTELRKVFLYNSLYLIGYGLVIGNVLAILLYFFQRSTQFFKLDPSIYYVSFVPVQISWYEVLSLNVALVAIVFVVLIIPSMLISRISPIKTIQFK
ncbi:ABC transporter permease [Sphingobacterium corticibacter]|uniref:ABC transporter permease n=1 Tax=Sphingobacterium corticibacter TaxID=2171749 RepID=A0A2T8HIK3_9SPHI|nr:FtsX-like permease family protein [Sphingobacterium corticibacter]PVH25269.1 ABC transporter permease [Sphingobacterium corticibacter]